MPNPYMKESGWPYEAGTVKYEKNNPLQLYVDHKDGVRLYDATPQGLHDAVTENVRASYMPDDDDDANDCNQFVAELVESYIYAIQANEKNAWTRWLPNVKERNQTKAA